MQQVPESPTLLCPPTCICLHSCQCNGTNARLAGFDVGWTSLLGNIGEIVINFKGTSNIVIDSRLVKVGDMPLLLGSEYKFPGRLGSFRGVSCTWALLCRSPPSRARFEPPSCLSLLPAHCLWAAGALKVQAYQWAGFPNTLPSVPWPWPVPHLGRCHGPLRSRIGDWKDPNQQQPSMPGPPGYLKNSESD